MFLTYNNNRYILEAQPHEKARAKSLGFKWDEELNVWATTDWLAAMLFVHKKAGEVESNVATGLQMLLDNYSGSWADQPLDGETDSVMKPFQIRGVQEILKRKTKLVFLSDEQGLGKTIQAIKFIQKFSVKVLIVTPATPKINWSVEIEKFGGQYLSSRVQILSGKEATVNAGAQVVITNYDLLQFDTVFESLMNFQSELLVGDEGHRAKNPDAIRTKRLFILADKAKKFLVLTGTPIPNRPIEIFPIIKKFCPKALGPYADKRRFQFRYCAGYQGKWGFNDSGSSNEKELNIRLRSTCMIRRTKKQIFGETKKPHQLISIETNEEVASLVIRENELAKEFLQKNENIPTIGEIAELRQKIALAKVDISVDWIKDILLTTQKIVVFAHHRAVMAALKELLKEFNPEVIQGGVTTKKKQEIVEKFQKDNSSRILIGQLQSAGEAITLTKSHNVVFVEIEWSPGAIAQCIDRCDRIGQTELVQAWFITTRGSIEEHMLKTALDKSEDINEILDLYAL